MTERRPFTKLAAAIFLLMALVHLYRVIFGFDISIGGTHVSQAVSWLALAVTALLAVMLYGEARR
jgi:hypothetical protein